MAAGVRRLTTGPAPARPGFTRRRAAQLAAGGAAWWAAPAGSGWAGTALAAETASLTGLLVTLAATAEGGDESPAGGSLVVEVTLTADQHRQV